MSYFGNTPIIGDHNAHEHQSVMIDGEIKGKGQVPRDFGVQPMRAVPTTIKVMTSDQILAATKYNEDNKCSLTHIRETGNNGQHIPSLDQGQKGYCWAHSSTQSLIIYRASLGLPYVPLSAYMVACLIKNYADEGGWAALSMDWLSKNGTPDQKFWAQGSMSSSNDNQAMRDNAKLHLVTEQWADPAVAQYDRKMSWDQDATLLCSNIPVPSDFNWWSHSVLAMKLVIGAQQRAFTRTDSGKLASLEEFERIWAMNHPVTQGLGKAILNSWSDSYGDKGIGVLTGDKAISDGSVAPASTLATAA